MDSWTWLVGSSNHQNALVEWMPFNQKLHLVMWASGHFSVLALSSLPPPRGRESTTPWPSNCGFGGLQIDLRAPTINLARMDTTRLKITFGVVGE
jgi:hypothetical protein